MDRTTGRRISGIDHVRQSVADILTTPLGSRLERRNYGSLLPSL
ncbi:UNVERIFIED_ORG: phage baseplate assembly protein W, partial [Comamonas terrigena]